MCEGKTLIALIPHAGALLSTVKKWTAGFGRLVPGEFSLLFRAP